ncbi:hypothetical protein [Bifidobacterium scaligerum]|uniref:hypothetical protein n=1 Tax=Bifidobacterium scaligerum TaxID=2052656 RepID=UPI001054531D|nr:hypothetical protein [Bifidobacterium scaligerum]
MTVDGTATLPARQPENFAIPPFPRRFGNKKGFPEISENPDGGGYEIDSKPRKPLKFQRSFLSNLVSAYMSARSASALHPV